jgi:hypothetical protein
MTWETLLREGDPVAREGGLDAAERDRMRRAVLGAASVPPAREWTTRLAVAGLLGVVFGLGAWVRWETARAPVPAGFEPAVQSDRRQVQFATPGGTRVIWVFDSGFDVR